MCFHAIYRFKIAMSFSVDEEVSFKRIAESCQLEEPDVRRILRHAMTFRVFCEPRRGIVAHTAASRMLRNPHIHDWMGANCEDMWPAALRTVDALTKWPEANEPTQTVTEDLLQTNFVV